MTPVRDTRPDTGAEDLDAALNDPHELALLREYIERPAFRAAWIDIATGTIGCSQQQAKKRHGIGGDSTKWMMLTLEAMDVVSAPHETNKTRKLISPKTLEQAQATYADLCAVVGANPENSHD